MNKKNSMLAFGAAALMFVPAAFAADGAAIFKAKCAICHKVDAKGVGPAVKAMNPDEAVLRSTIADGRKAMPAFGKSKKLSAEEIDAVVAFLKSQQ